MTYLRIRSDEIAAVMRLGAATSTGKIAGVTVAQELDQKQFEAPDWPIREAQQVTQPPLGQLKDCLQSQSAAAFCVSLEGACGPLASRPSPAGGKQGPCSRCAPARANPPLSGL
jgi:hypothetical protein